MTRRFRSRPSRSLPRRTAILAVSVGLVLLVASCSSSSPDTTPSTAGSSSTPPTSAPAASGALHHSGTWLLDDQGRVVTDHGVNIIWKAKPYYPPSFTKADAKFLVSQGFTSARIGPLWSAVEPKPGHYDTAYVQHLVAFNKLLARFGIRTLIDFHQDFYSAAYGGDGAPAWASFDSACTTKPKGCSILDAPAAFDHLWNNTTVDGSGLIQHFAGAWRSVATALADATNVMGFDLLNEPYAGASAGCGLFAPCPAFETGKLADFYRTLITAIRRVAPHQLLFYEPVPQLTGAATALPAPLTDDPDLGFTFHYYNRSCDGKPDPTTPQAKAAQNAACTPAEAKALDNGINYAKRAGTPVLLGEFGGSGNYTDDANMVDLAGQRFTPWAYWMYYGADSTPGGKSGPGSVVIHADQPVTPSNVYQPLLDAIVVPYPEAIAGTPTSWSLDRSTWTMKLSYSTTPVKASLACAGAATEVFVPRRHYPHGYHVEVTGARVVSPPGWPWVELVAKPGAKKVSMTLTPATGATTGVPSTARDPKAPTPTCGSGGGGGIQ